MLFVVSCYCWRCVVCGCLMFGACCLPLLFMGLLLSCSFEAFIGGWCLLLISRDCCLLLVSCCFKSVDCSLCLFGGCCLLFVVR